MQPRISLSSDLPFFRVRVYLTDTLTETEIEQATELTV
jgi:hypothetical protein